jgi:hypothetical protein
MTNFWPNNSNQAPVNISWPEKNFGRETTDFFLSKSGRKEAGKYFRQFYEEKPLFIWNFFSFS